MRLTVLGSSGTHPRPGRACSSYLVEHDGSRLLLDCGNGSLANLLAVSAPAAVDALLLSHLHPDHVADVWGLYLARRFADAPPLPVYGVAGTAERLASLLPGDARFATQLDFRTVAAGDVVRTGALDVRLAAAAHPVPTVAARVEGGGRVLAYSADTGPTDAVVDCARGADVFLCEATFSERDRPIPEGLHCTGAEAGAMAAAAGARRLVVTHVSPAHDPEDIAAEARTRFDGEVLVAADRRTIEV